MSEAPLSSSFTAHPVPWLTLGLLVVGAWLLTLQQTLSMLALPLSGTMGLSPGPFLISWSCMMVAMMFPALFPLLITRYASTGRVMHQASSFLSLCLFLAAYLAVWTLFGVPTFFLAQFGQWCFFHIPWLATALGIVLLILIGLYQMSPLEKRYLTQCHAGFCQASTPPSLSAQVGEGLRHGLACLGCCGGLMLVMIPVGLMNLPWMILLTVIIFLEKTWKQGRRLSFFVGFALLIFAVFALVQPGLLPGLVPLTASR